MKRIKLLFASLLVLFVFAVPVFATSTTVVGPGTQVDIQDALDDPANYDIVYLQGEFDFGTDGSVSITRDVEIIGVDSGGNQALIMGGEKSISCDEMVSLTVKNLRMEGAVFSAISVSKSTGLEISGCTIENLIGKWGEGPLGAYHFIFSIWVSTAPWPDYNITNPGDITGNVVIKNNYIDPVNPACASSGIMIQGLNTVLEITGNEVYNCESGAIILDQNAGATTISDNTIDTLATGICLGHFCGDAEVVGEENVVAQGNVIVTGNNITSGARYSGILVWPVLHTATTSILISQNSITVPQEGYNGISISVYYTNTADNIVVTNNAIDMDSTTAPYWSSGIWVEHGDNNTIKANTITGTGHYGIRLYAVANNNTIMDNNLVNFTAVTCPIRLYEGADNNLIQGNIIGEAGENNPSGMYIESDENRLVNNTFGGAYPGWEYDEATGDPGGPGCVLLSVSANDNHEVALKTDYPPGFDLCKQVLDLPDFEDKSYILYNPVALIPLGGGYYLIPKNQVLTVGPYTFGSAGFDDKFGIDNPTTAFSLQREEALPILTWIYDVGTHFLTSVNYMTHAGLVKTDKPYLTYTAEDPSWTVSYPDPTGNALTPYVLKNNKVPGYEKCLRQPDELISAMQERLAGLGMEFPEPPEPPRLPE